MTRIVEPEVTLVAHTQLACGSDGKPSLERWMSIDPNSTDAEALTTAAGRSCYLSYHRPNSATAKDSDYIERTLHEQGHGSIAEHATATFHITGVSRALLAELTRHRQLSFSVLSQRFVNEEEANIVIPPAFQERNDRWVVHKYAKLTSAHYSHLVAALQEDGVPRKQAREAARAVLPNMTETRIYLSGNHRAFYEMISKRIKPDADKEFQVVARLLLAELLKLAPSIYKPLEHHPKETE